MLQEDINEAVLHCCNTYVNMDIPHNDFDRRQAYHNIANRILFDKYSVTVNGTRFIPFWDDEYMEIHSKSIEKIIVLTDWILRTGMTTFAKRH